MPKTKRESMSEALQRSDQVVSFLQQGERQEPHTPPRQETREERVAVTVRLPKHLTHALIDASAERRKERAEGWSQQDIVAEALGRWLAEKRNGEDYS